MSIGNLYNYINCIGFIKSIIPLHCRSNFTNHFNQFLNLIIMTKLKVNRLQELAASLSQSEQLSNSAQGNVKGGCSSCQDIRIPPGSNFNVTVNLNLSGKH